MRGSWLLLLLTIAAGLAQAAAKPITGVSCGGGFYVKSPDGHLHWVLPDENQSTQEVYSGEGSLYAMVECGTGVISVFRHQALFEAYYSPNCMNLGHVAQETQKVYEGREAITAFSRSGDGIVTTLQEGGNWYSENCKNIAEPPAEKISGV